MGSGFRTFTAGEILTASNVQNYLQDQVVMTFAGSAARSSAIGTANFEEGMTSYLTDTDKMEVYNGTNWVSVAPTTTQGLTLISSTSFSAVASQSLAADTFTTTYDNYKLLIDITAVTADATISLKMRKAGTDSSVLYYSSNSWAYTTNTANPDARANETTGMRLGFCDAGSSGHYYSFDVTLFRPKINDRTTATATTVHCLTTSPQQGGAGGYWHDFADSYDSATLIASSGNITGTIYCYGWTK